MTPAPTKNLSGLTGAVWEVAAFDEAALTALQMATSETPLVLRCLMQRGLTDAAEITKFLNPEFPANLHPPTMLRDMAHAVTRLQDAIKNRERIMVVTDFDVDGTTSSVILSQTLRLLGGGDLVDCYIPDRFSEGYGLSPAIVERAAETGCRIILTADIGIKSHAEARLAKERGIDLIICDHHLPDGEDVPAEAYAVLCPKGSSGEGYPNKDLAACGVSLKLADALLAEHPKRAAILASLAKLSAIGTVADMVNLSTSENRAIVSYGLQALGEPTPNHGLRALLKVAQVNQDGQPVSTYDIGFKLGPRINAAGRIAHANTVIQLFDAKTEAEATELAHKLDTLNHERQQIQAGLVERLSAYVEYLEGRLEDRVLVFSGTEAEGYHRGIVGIACSKIVEKTGRPTFIAAVNEAGMAHGSARSIHGFHLVEAMDSASDLFVKYGGHPMAAGFTIEATKLDELKARLNRFAAEEMAGRDLTRTFTADAEIALSDITLELIRSLQRLEPHGIGNPAPLFLLRGLQNKGVNVLKEKHLKISVSDGRATLPALWWSSVEHYKTIAKAPLLSLLCRPEINSWNGRETCQLKVVDAAVE
jgi:single-stranded-DNA-specific exonuclease